MHYPSLFLALTLYTLTNTAFAEPLSYTTYTNTAAEFSLAIPQEVLYPQGEADNPLKQEFKSADNLAVLSVFAHGGHNETIDEIYQKALHPSDQAERVVTYKKLGNNWFVITGFKNEEVYYTKMILSPNDGMVKGFYFHYPKLDKQVYDPITIKLSKTLREYPN